MKIRQVPSPPSVSHNVFKVKAINPVCHVIYFKKEIIHYHYNIIVTRSDIFTSSDFVILESHLVWLYNHSYAGNLRYNQTMAPTNMFFYNFLLHSNWQKTRSSLMNSYYTINNFAVQFINENYKVSGPTYYFCRYCNPLQLLPMNEKILLITEEVLKFTSTNCSKILARLYILFDGFKIGW